ncbi:MAG: YdeI/OmpD-associated family protein [Candidatus Dormibacteraeota bacterium]|nr:YdeI/OmpD-associated family protein [Candidatus Dormibacteraeota bacterium]
MAERDQPQRTFTVVVERDARGRTVIALPFDPSEAWGTRSRHHVHGTVAGRGVRGPLESHDGAARLVLGPAWCRDAQLEDGERVEVTLAPEGPQLGALAPDVVAALDARPEARAFFESLATFYRTGYLRWVDATKRRPDVRAARIAEMVELLAAGHKQRPS